MRCFLIVMAIVVVGVGFASAACSASEMTKCFAMMSEPCKMMKCFTDTGCAGEMTESVRSVIKEAGCSAGVSQHVSVGLLLILAPIQLIMYYGNFP